MAPFSTDACRGLKTDIDQTVASASHQIETISDENIFESLGYHLMKTLHNEYIINRCGVEISKAKDPIQSLIEKSIYSDVDKILDPELDKKSSQGPVYSRTVPFAGMNVTASFYDTWKDYDPVPLEGLDPNSIQINLAMRIPSMSRNSQRAVTEEATPGLVEAYLYSLGNPTGHRTSDRIVVITRNS